MLIYSIYRNYEDCTYDNYISFLIIAANEQDAMQLVVDWFGEHLWVTTLVDGDEIGGSFPYFLSEPTCTEAIGVAYATTPQILDYRYSGS